MLGALMMLSTLAEPLDVRIEGNSLVTGLHVAMLDPTGAVVAPADVKYALLEIGCSDRDTLDDKLDQDYRDAFLLSFEPLMDKYAVLASRGTRRMAKGADRAVPVGHHHTRGVVLPIAVSAHDARRTSQSIDGPAAHHFRSSTKLPATRGCARTARWSVVACQQSRSSVPFASCPPTSPSGTSRSTRKALIFSC